MSSTETCPGANVWFREKTSGPEDSRDWLLFSHAAIFQTSS